MRIDETEFIGIYQHVIKLNYPCGNMEHVKRLKGEPPTLVEITAALKRHRDECEVCRSEQP